MGQWYTSSNLGLERVLAAALSAVVPVVMLRKENTDAAHGVGTLLAHLLNLAVVFDVVVPESSQGSVLILRLHLLRGSVSLLLALLAASEKPQKDAESCLLASNVSYASGAVKDKASKCQASLGNTLGLSDTTSHFIYGSCLGNIARVRARGNTLQDPKKDLSIRLKCGS